MLQYFLHVSSFRCNALQFTRRWNRNYNLLLAYGEQEGTYNVPKRWKQILPTVEVVNLGTWLCFQRHVRDTTLTHERKDKLQVLVDTGRLLWNMKVLQDENEV